MATYYLHKQTIVIAILCSLAVGGVATYAYWNPYQEQAPTLALQDTNTDQDSALASSSDDWKSQFFNADQGVSSIKRSGAATSTDAIEPLNATGQFSIDVFSHIIDLKQSNLIKNSSIVQTTISDVLAQNLSQPIATKIYSVNDIIVTQETGAVALKAYANQVGSIMSTYLPKQNSAELALSGIRNENPSYIEDLQSNVNSYDKMIRSLLIIPTPQSMGIYHVGLINALSQFKTLSLSLETAGADPITAIKGLDLYKTAYQLGLESILYIRNALITAGVTYTNADGGSFFFRLKLKH